MANNSKDTPTMIPISTSSLTTTTSNSALPSLSASFSNNLDFQQQQQQQQQPNQQTMMMSTLGDGDFQYQQQQQQQQQSFLPSPSTSSPATSSQQYYFKRIQRHASIPLEGGLEHFYQQQQQQQPQQQQQQFLHQQLQQPGQQQSQNASTIGDFATPMADCLNATSNFAQAYPLITAPLIMNDQQMVQQQQQQQHQQQQVYTYCAQQAHYQPTPGGGFSVTTEQQTLATVVNSGGGGGTDVSGIVSDGSSRINAQQRQQQQNIPVQAARSQAAELQMNFPLQQQQSQQQQQPPSYSAVVLPPPRPPPPPPQQHSYPRTYQQTYKQHADNFKIIQTQLASSLESCTTEEDRAAAYAAAASALTQAVFRGVTSEDVTAEVMVVQPDPPMTTTDLLDSATEVAEALALLDPLTCTQPPTTFSPKGPDGQPTSVNLADVHFRRLNSYTELMTLIPPRTVNQCYLPGCLFQLNPIADYLKDPSVRIFLRFCRYDRSTQEQVDRLPRSFNFLINKHVYMVKNRTCSAPYDITERVALETTNDIHICFTFDVGTKEDADEVLFAIFLMKKKDHETTIEEFRHRWRHPFKAKFSLELAMKKLHPIDYGEDELAVVEKDNQIRLSLLCPITNTRIITPARSLHCNHVQCFDAETFINLNKLSHKWKCPICNIYIKLENLIMDGLYVEFLAKAPLSCTEVIILPNGSYEFVMDELPPSGGEGNSDANSDATVDPSQPSTSASAQLQDATQRPTFHFNRDTVYSPDSSSSDSSSDEGGNENVADGPSADSAVSTQPLKKRKMEGKQKKAKRSHAIDDGPPKFVAKSSLKVVPVIECVTLGSDEEEPAQGPEQKQVIKEEHVEEENSANNNLQPEPANNIQS